MENKVKQMLEAKNTTSGIFKGSFSYIMQLYRLIDPTPTTTDLSFLNEKATIMKIIRTPHKDKAPNLGTQKTRIWLVIKIIDADSDKVINAGVKEFYKKELRRLLYK